MTRRRRGPGLHRRRLPGKQPHAEDSAAPFRVLRDLLDLGAAHLAHARKERPLIGPWREGVVQEHAVALLPRALLQRQGNQVAEAALRHRVLVGETAVVRIQPDVRPALHGFGQHERTEPAGQGGRNRAVEEDPDVPAMTGARPFQRSRHTQAATGLEERRHLPASRPCRSRWPGSSRSRPGAADRRRRRKAARRHPGRTDASG